MNPLLLALAVVGAGFTVLGVLVARGRLASTGLYARRYALLFFGPALLLLGTMDWVTQVVATPVVSTAHRLVFFLFLVAGVISVQGPRWRTAGPPPPTDPPTLHLEPWDDSGLQLLRDCNSPEMTEYLGGPESEEKLLDRHRRYLTYTGNGAWSFRIVFEGDNVGSVNYWDDDDNYEMGWAIAPLYQGLGFAKEAVALALAHAATGSHSTVHAMPHIDNAASNAVARSAGFVNLGQRRIEYPVGHFMIANDWVFDLRQLQGRSN